MIDHPERKSPRLKHYDYSHANLYFVTLCVQNRLPLFGQVINGEMQRSSAGEMVSHWWNLLSEHFSGIENEPFLVMPNHFHGIVANNSTQPLITMIQWFKTMTTNAYLHGIRDLGWPTFERKLWQRSFHDHIICNEAALLKIREYIRDNPLGWTQDTFFSE